MPERHRRPVERADRGCGICGGDAGCRRWDHGAAGTPAAGGGTDWCGGDAGCRWWHDWCGGDAGCRWWHDWCGGDASSDGGTTGRCAGVTVLDAAGAPIDAVTGAPIDPAAVGAAGRRRVSGACDPDTGVCAASGGPVQAAGAAASAAVGPIAATTLPKGSGWNASLALVLLIVLLTIGVVLAPALAWRHFSEDADRMTSGASAAPRRGSRSGGDRVWSDRCGQHQGAAAPEAGKPGHRHGASAHRLGGDASEGRGAFADLEITVNQTKNLTNQAVSVTWTGATPTIDSGGSRFGENYLQIFQCWGDDDGTIR